jgi:hypothetical protein
MLAPKSLPGDEKGQPNGGSEEEDESNGKGPGIGLPGGAKPTLGSGAEDHFMALDATDKMPGMKLFALSFHNGIDLRNAQG